MRQNRQEEVVELSRPLGVDKIPQGGMEDHIVARPAEREALATRFGLVSLPRLEAWLTIDHAEGRMIAVSGRFESEVEQICVVSLDPFMASVGDSIDALFTPDYRQGAGNPHVEAVDQDDPEPIINGMIDLGELVAQHLGVALDPYPRKPGAQLAYGGAGAPAPESQAKGASLSGGDESGKVRPFAQLAQMVKKEKG